MLREEDRHFLMALYMAVCVIFTWKGVWDGVYEIPLPEGSHALVFLFLGLTLLTFSGLIFKEFDPLGGFQKAVLTKLHQVHIHPQRKQFQLVYLDMVTKKEVTISGASILAIEKGALIISDARHKREIFIPVSKVRKVLLNGKPYWKA